jgi:hypothetical protein
MPNAQFMTLNEHGQEVPADEMGRPLKVIPGPEDEDAETEETDSEDNVLPEPASLAESEAREEEALPEDIDDNCLLISTESGWVTFKPEHIQDEKHVLVLILKGKADSFIPKLGSQFRCHWRDADGKMRTQELYYAGMRFKLPQIPDNTILGFIKRS